MSYRNKALKGMLNASSPMKNTKGKLGSKRDKDHKKQIKHTAGNQHGNIYGEMGRLIDS